MKLFQMTVFTLVLFANVHWQWTPNGYVASLGGAIVAYSATHLMVLAIEAGLLGRRAAQRLARKAKALGFDAAAGNADSARLRRA